MTPLLSIVIIGRNEGARLVRCLESIRGMAPVGGPVEIVYADSNSTDGSPERAAAAGARVIAVDSGPPTAARGRNAGWQAASGTYILFLDGDTILHPRFAAKALAAFGDPRVAVVFGNRREIHPEASIYNRILDLDWNGPAGEADYCGGDAVIRRDVLEEVGGYDETLIAGEEPEMCRRMRGLGYRILHLDVPMTGHDLAMTRWSQYWRRAVRCGHAYAEVAERFRGTALPFWEREVRHNRRQTAILALMPAGTLAVAAVTSWWLLALIPLFYGALAVRTARRAAWKGGSRSTMLLYGLHSHLQQFPIFLGQWQFYRDRRAGRRRGLIEYKGPGS
jgi:GT2 family glycosyltransferase